MKSEKKLSVRRSARLRTKLRKRANGRPRLSVFRSSRHIYAQVIDDNKSTTLAAVSSNDKNLNKSIAKANGKIEMSKVVGESLAEKLKNNKISQVIFDRNGYKYHGRVKALADSVREAGIKL